MTTEPNTPHQDQDTPASSTNKTKSSKHKFGSIALIAVLVLGLWLVWRPTPSDPQADISHHNPQAPTTTHTPVIYDVENWQISKLGSLATAKNQLGGAGLSDSGLDIQGNPANVIRFVAGYEPPLTLIESDKFVELAWYYAPPVDTQDNKAASLAHAKKAHSFATMLMGDTGHEIITQMLTTPEIDHSSTKPAISARPTVHIAACKAYQCQLVIANGDGLHTTRQATQ